ncbi:MAG: hypothetical protein ABIZ57_10395 [Candidatus Limnocylindria bacterium]
MHGANGAGWRRGGHRILLGPVEIAGYYAGLEAGLLELGVHALAIDLDGNPFRYGPGGVRLPLVVRMAKRARVGQRAASSARVRRLLWVVARIASHLLVLIWAIVRYDVFVFGFGTSFFRLRDLPLLRLLGKRIVFVFHGSDARPPYIDGVRVAPDRAPPIAELLLATSRMKESIRRIERYADVVVAQPAFSHFFERPVVNFFSVGVPWRDQPAHETAVRSDDPVRILHSPSDPIVKGSARIHEVIERLRSDGLNLELTELRSVPNAVVLHRIATCDFMIDQIYSDAPMVGFATEAAVAGKPAIVGGYAWPENHRIIGSEAMPPVEECAPELLADAIRHLVTNREHREALGARAHTFVTGRWSGTAIAKRLLMLVDGSAPDEWLFDPKELRYLEGCGLSREQARASVAAVVAAGGPAALCLSDKPELERRFLEFAIGPVARN